MDNNIVRVGLVAAAVVVIAVIAINLLPGSPAPGGEPSNTPSPEPSNAESSTPQPSTASGLPPGPHLLTDEGAFGVPVTIDIAARDWFAEPAALAVLKNRTANPPLGAGLIVFGGDIYVYGDACEWESTRPDTPAATVDELVAALSAQTSRYAYEVADVTVGGYPGKSIRLQVPNDAVFADCDRGQFRTLVEAPLEDDSARYHQGADQTDELWIVDVDGTIVLLDAAYFTGASAETVAQLRYMAESATFESP